MTARLDIAATVGEAYRGAWNHLGEMVRLIWLPGALYFSLSVAGVFIDVEQNRALAVVINLATLFLWPIIAVAWHRFILMGDAPPGKFHFSFGRREARYLIVSVFLTLLFAPGVILSATPAFLPANMTASLLSFFGVLLLMVAIYFMVRLTLLLPAVSVGDPVNPRLVLERTRGNFWRLVAVFAAIVLPMFVILFLVGSLVGGNLVMNVAAVAVLSLVLILFAIVNIAVLSIAYRELIGPPGTQAPDSGDY
ncbi:hypothetical protein [Parvibaculum sp.]|uniref:hypothetical protein n=1 Tax=Parvibaculum sp. TaxID=2024848 RepID=UPI000C4E2246|nr:hypothetical protein [Parvibaculum sp.]MAU61319.1 hypothetical protein [Parvibaculum sp.]MBO6667391.1 hypothetical protein [Parvibaculum sp.]MBO6693102.1 hypothetical protein [Parvibaculum sp.]MBO6713943.1 hypothetical protein [Parvibaculum sp.]|tara:strand:- start:4603 stop:5355 length:753 start_codon:yes stop_codon:yes gene_type:complete